MIQALITHKNIPLLIKKPGAYIIIDQPGAHHLQQTQDNIFIEFYHSLTGQRPSFGGASRDECRTTHGGASQDTCSLTMGVS
jgi:hypothetical protein